MEKETYPALNTREFVAKWHSVVEEHLVAELADLLPALTAEAGGDSIGREQCALLSRHFAYALQVAGSDSGGLQAAVEYLRQAASTEHEGPQSN
jgi:hypothetical protein